MLLTQSTKMWPHKTSGSLDWFLNVSHLLHKQILHNTHKVLSKYKTTKKQKIRFSSKQNEMPNLKYDNFHGINIERLTEAGQVDNCHVGMNDGGVCNHQSHMDPLDTPLLYDQASGSENKPSMI